MIFGLDIQQEMELWWDGEFMPVLAAKYGSFSVFVRILDPAAQHDWARLDEVHSVLVALQHVVSSEDFEENVYRKLRFTVRTGLDSSEARRQPHLIEPGDFPHAGAIAYRGIAGGASGLPEESDVWVVQQVIDHVVALRAARAQLAVQACRSGVPGWTYLPNELPPS
jgi:hypothetical protein